MNQYPWWKNALIGLVVVLGFIYALPNLYGDNPAVEIQAAHGAAVNRATVAQIRRLLVAARLPYKRISRAAKGVQVRFRRAGVQMRARDLIGQKLGPGFHTALALAPAAPAWLRALGARPMYLGLDLRGGVHFLLRVDMHAALHKALLEDTRALRRALRHHHIRYREARLAKTGVLELRFRNAAQAHEARRLMAQQFTDLAVTSGPHHALRAVMTPAAIAARQHYALEQNLTALRRRVNELGVAAPVIQQEGRSRIVVELPGVEDIARAKEILGRTATLEIHMVDSKNSLASAVSNGAPPGTRIYDGRHGQPILLYDRVLYSGDDITNASAGVDPQTGQPVVNITLNGRGAAINARVTRHNVGQRMAVVYVEVQSHLKRNDQGIPIRGPDGRRVRVTRKIERVITAPVIREALGGSFQITGIGSVRQARNLALLLRAGALAAPVSIIAERTVGPSLGAANITRGFYATLFGFLAIAVFMAVYYRIFGMLAAIALATNVVLLVAVLSILQATLTLPGIAGIALTVGMAIDANVLIFERIREELRNKNSPQAAIATGFDKAMGTIVDSNMTTFIAGLALFWLGSGSVRGFAITLCLGILTSLFSAILVTRALVNAVYGRRRRLAHVGI
ncbi:protein translocase subunit SecD [Acidiferrobacter sp. SPIII_3]|jgi:preprotein translocase subunit SecD|uniref:protein translocase subunit SecD n=1 Tax=Acidiferrobacter sp. SPIII_3 TaxID=1281578 RepID=UPI000D73DEFA|nr:protein translocase subunit SecD [Acidiferrobacter sp. SPIII_3]AWP23852.1 protein translocase subunit SecD [Acidiferrobacter sp. SPIII_3]